MWLRFLGASVLTLVLQASFQSDSAQTLRQKYGVPVSESYLIRPGVTASASYGPSGIVCEIVVSPQQLWNRTLDYKELTEIINEIAPVNQRGTRQIGGFDNSICLTNDCGGTIDSWKNLSVLRNGGDGTQRYA